MVPAAVVESSVTDLAPRLAKGDTLIDGGNSYYIDDQRRAKLLEPRGINYVDVGTSGGGVGARTGLLYDDRRPRRRGRAARSDFQNPSRRASDRSIALPGVKNSAARPNRVICTVDRTARATSSKWCHNGIEYGVMAAYAEGLNILQHADAGLRTRSVDAETTPLRSPEHYQFKFNMPDIAEVWRRGSVIASWLLDLTAAALAKDPQLSTFAGRVSDSGEGRWTLLAAIEEGTPAPVLSAALYQRFASRGEDEFADKLLSAMR